MNKKGFAMFSAVGTLLSVFFSLIIAYVIFGIFNAAQYADFGFILCFVIFNILVVIGLSSFGGILSAACGTPAFAACWTAVIVYTAVQFISTFSYLIFAPALVGNQFYILGNLIAIFLLLIVTLPIITSGLKHNTNDSVNTYKNQSAQEAQAAITAQNAAIQNRYTQNAFEAQAALNAQSTSAQNTQSTPVYQTPVAPASVSVAPKTKLCECGNELAPDAIFCNVCGKKF